MHFQLFKACLLILFAHNLIAQSASLIKNTDSPDYPSFQQSPKSIHKITPFCPYAPQLLEQTRRTAQEYAAVPTTIEMGMEMWDPTMMEEGAADDWGLF